MRCRVRNNRIRRRCSRGGARRLGWLGAPAPFLAASCFPADNCLRDLLHRLPLLAAPPPQGKVSLLFSQSRFALQNPFGTLDNLTRQEFIGEPGAFLFKTRQLDLGADEKTDRSEERRVGKECRSRWSP